MLNLKEPPLPGSPHINYCFCEGGIILRREKFTPGEGMPQASSCSPTPPIRRRFCIRRLIGVFLAGALVMGSAAGLWRRQKTAPLRTFPLKYWDELAPEAAGMDAKRLATLAKTLRGSGCVVRGGKMVYHWGLPENRSNVWSASKPVIVHALLMAVQQGKLASLDVPVSTSEPRLMDLNPGLGYKDRTITWRHMMSQTSCYGVQESPGTAFDYSDFQIALFIDSLFEKVYQATGRAVDHDIMHPVLYRELHMQDAPYLGVRRQNKAIGRLNISPRDFCRFGLLYLRGGKWLGRQLLPESVVQETLRSPLPATFPRTAGHEAGMISGQRSLGGGKNQDDAWGSYSNTWWTNGKNSAGERLWEDAPEDTVGAFGQGGKWALVLIPSLDLVASWVDTTLPGGTAMCWNETGRLALSSALSRLAKTVRPAKR